MPVVGLIVQLDKAVLHSKAQVAGNLVFETDADSPTIAPVIEFEPIQRQRIRVAAVQVDFRTSPSGLAIKQPLITGDAEAASHRRDGIYVGTEVHGWKEDTMEVSAQIGTADGGFHTQHDIPELLIVADLATANEPTRAFVEPFAGQCDIGKGDVGQINVTPSSADVTADVEAGPTHGCRNRIGRS